MLTKLSRKEKIQTITEGWNEVLKNHTCGDYIGWAGHEYHWGIEIRPRSYWFVVDGVGRMRYDFDSSFDSNLEALMDNMGEWVGY